MKELRYENRFLVYLVNFSGLYLKSIEKVTKKKWVHWVFAFWTKISVTLLPIYLGSVIPFFIFDEAPLMLKLSVFRRMMAFTLFLIKIVYFYLYSTHFERLIDLWDSSFKENFYSHSREVSTLFPRYLFFLSEKKNDCENKYNKNLLFFIYFILSYL